MLASGIAEGIGMPSARTLISTGLCVEFMSPPCLARDGGTGDSTCFRILPISTVRPAVTALSNRCRCFLSALTVFCTLCLVDTVALYRVAKVFERCFLSTSWTPTVFSIRRCFTLVITCSFPVLQLLGDHWPRQSGQNLWMPKITRVCRHLSSPCLRLLLLSKQCLLWIRPNV